MCLNSMVLILNSIQNSFQLHRYLECLPTLDGFLQILKCQKNLKKSQRSMKNLDLTQHTCANVHVGAKSTC